MQQRFDRLRQALIAVVAGLLLSVSSAPARAQDYGRFGGELVAELGKDGQELTLSKSFDYIDPSNTQWRAPAGVVITGVCIPAFVWPVMGSPLNERFQRSTVIHEVACRNRRRPWQEVDQAFYQSLLASGVDEPTAKVLYGAVYHLGPRWPRRESLGIVPANNATMAVRLANGGAMKGEKANVSFLPGVEAPSACATCVAGAPDSVTGAPAPFVPRTVEVVVRYSPIKSRMTLPEQFEPLRAAIVSRDMSLEQIEDFETEGVAKGGALATPDLVKP